MLKFFFVVALYVRLGTRPRHGFAHVYKSTANTVPHAAPMPSAVRETRADAIGSRWAYDRAIKLVAPIDKKSSGNGAESEILEAGPNAANSTDDDSRPMNAASIRDMRGEQI